jgi:hypothetical protein
MADMPPPVVSNYEHSEDPRDPLNIAVESSHAAWDELTEIRLGPLDANDRAAIDRATNMLRGAVARLQDVERLSRPPVVQRHPGDGTLISPPYRAQ